MTGEEDTIELGWYMRTLRRHSMLIVVGTILTGGFAFMASGLLPLQYEGVSTLLVVPPAQPVPGAPQINTATFRAMVENNSLASEVITELGLDTGDRPLTPGRFLEDALEVEDVRGTNILRVRVTLRDPQQAAEASRRLALKAIALSQKVVQQDGATIQGQLKEYLEAAQQRMQAAEREFLEFKQNAQIELMAQDTSAQLKERGDLLRLVVDIEAERARLAAAEAELSRQPALLSAPRLPGTDQAFRQLQNDAKPQIDPGSARRDLSRGEANTQHLDLTNPFVNPVHQTLEYQIAVTRTRLAALTKERDELINVKGLGGKTLSELSDLYRRQVEHARLEAAYELARKVHGDLALRYEESRTQSFGNTAQLQVIDLALPPDRPLTRYRLWYTRWGLAVGFALTVMVAFVLERRARGHGPAA